MTDYIVRIPAYLKPRNNGATLGACRWKVTGYNPDTEKFETEAVEEQWQDAIPLGAIPPCGMPTIGTQLR